jgi:esterase
MPLYFRKYGNGKPLIILHGLFGQSDNWNTLAKRYAEAGLEVYAVDQRNHGLSFWSDEWNYAVMAKDLADLIEAEKISNPILLGHSMGGKTVMHFDLNYPSVAEKIIVADISPRAYKPHHAQVLEGLLSISMSKLQSRKEAEDALIAFGLDIGTRQFLLKNLYRIEEAHPKIGQQIFDWRFNLDVISKQIQSVNEGVPEGCSETPALFLRGTKSDYISDADCDLIQSIFHRAAIVEISEAGHWLHAEKPQEFFQRTLDFIKS